MRPQPDEAADYYYTYINLVPDGDIVDILEKQLDETMSFLQTVSEEKSWNDTISRNGRCVSY